ncbi:MAG: tRNA pseudouridine(55) synthase TruB [Kistimonas sp.]|nr:tRNA pseudouridine(55) synthase TruB [Kistimonas sp.]
MSRNRRSRGRPVSGILLVDKPPEASSNAVLQRVKALYGAAKAGHTGSLDPLATGLLPVCLGEATKLSQYLLDANKRYRARAKLGIRTTTGDSEGEPVSERPVSVTQASLDAALAQFRGEIEQCPSMYSAIKHKGKPLYSYARQGIEVERPLRRISIFRLDLVAFSGDELVIEVDCSKGTYIRTLVEDIGEVLGCGAHVTALRRLAVGPYTEDQSYTIAALEQWRDDGGHSALDQKLLAQDSAVSHWPGVTLGDAGSFYLTQGQAVQVAHAPASGFVRLYRADQQKGSSFLGIGEIQQDGLVAPRRLISA